MNNESINITEDNTVESSQMEKLPEETLSIYAGMNEVFKFTRVIINDMKQGEKITVRDLSDKVAAQIDNLPSGNITNLVQMFLKQCKDVSVEIGRGGGVFKGGKPKRVDIRPRCQTCNQVIRNDTQKHTSIVD